MGRSGNKATSSDYFPVRRRHSRTSDADEYEPSVAKDELESPPLSSCKARACKRTRFEARENERNVYSLRRVTVVSETPRFMLTSNNITVVTEESSLSDGSILHHYGKSKKPCIDNPVAYKRRTDGVKHRMKQKRSVGFLLQKELEEPLSMDQPTLDNSHVDHVSAGKRKRIATNFYKPCIKPGTTAASLLRPKRERVATSFFCPSGENVLREEEMEYLNESRISVHEPDLDKSSMITQTRQTSSKRLFGEFPMDEKVQAAKCRSLPPRKRNGSAATSCIRPVRRVIRSTGDVGCSGNNGRPKRSAATTVSILRTRQSRIDNALDTERVETAGSCVSCAQPCRTLLFEDPPDLCYFTSVAPLSHSILLQQYNELVDQGRCDSISFGRTVSSARIAIDRKLTTLSEKCPDEIEDAEITADHREFKRNLRTFVAFEAQEKLALVHERQDYEEGIQVPMSKAVKSSTVDKMELSKLVDLPIILSRTSRMSSRQNACSEGPNCFLCGKNSRRTEPTLLQHTITPFMRSFDINAVEEGQAPVESRGRRSIVTRHGKQQDTARATIMALSELKHSIDFVAEYNSAAAGTV